MGERSHTLLLSFKLVVVRPGVRSPRRTFGRLCHPHRQHDRLKAVWTSPFLVPPVRMVEEPRDVRLLVLVTNSKAEQSTTVDMPTEFQRGPKRSSASLALDLRLHLDR